MNEVRFIDIDKPVFPYFPKTLYANGIFTHMGKNSEIRFSTLTVQQNEPGDHLAPPPTTKPTPFGTIKLNCYI